METRGAVIRGFGGIGAAIASFLARGLEAIPSTVSVRRQTDHGRGVRSVFSRYYQDRSKYSPHRGERECARRRARLDIVDKAA